ncbi:hypothetical protein FRC11_001791, partial [Ceratobasidium sp. 423]
PPLKCSHTNEDEPLGGLTLSTSHMSVGPSSPPPKPPNPKYIHHWKFDGRAKFRNAADTYFSDSKPLAYPL